MVVWCIFVLHDNKNTRKTSLNIATRGELAVEYSCFRGRRVGMEIVCVCEGPRRVYLAPKMGEGEKVQIRHSGLTTSGTSPRFQTIREQHWRDLQDNHNYRRSPGYSSSSGV